MRNSSLPFLLVVLVGLSGYLAYFIDHQKIPCVTPLSFALTSYDSRFSLPEQQVKADLDRAAHVWNAELGWNAFVDAGTSTPDLPVTFVFDATQEEVNSINQLSDNIDTLKTELTSIANQYGTLKKQYDALNARGEATQAMYDELQTLYQQYEAVRQKINADVSQGNDLPQGQVEEGLYTADKNGTRIQIFAFQSEPELVRTMTHEFGHALGLGHVSNTNSIMYPTNGANETLKLTSEDEAELNRACSAAKAEPIAVVYGYEHRILHTLRLD